SPRFRSAWSTLSRHSGGSLIAILSTATRWRPDSPLHGWNVTAGPLPAHDHREECSALCERLLDLCRPPRTSRAAHHAPCERALAADRSLPSLGRGPGTLGD